MRVLIFATILLFLENCSLSREKSKFSGNWYGCGKDGLYVELFIKDNLFKHSANNGVITKWCEFNIEGDTLTCFDPYISKDSVFVTKAKIAFVTKNEMKLDYITSNEQWTFYRIEEAITDLDNDGTLLKSTQQRADKIQCSDRRTIEEKKEDSLKREIKSIDFQF